MESVSKRFKNSLQDDQIADVGGGDDCGVGCDAGESAPGSERVLSRATLPSLQEWCPGNPPQQSGFSQDVLQRSQGGCEADSHC